jgi:hypothetical protein
VFEELSQILPITTNNFQLYTPGHLLHLTEDENGEIERKFIDYRDLQHLVCDGLTPLADHMALRVKRIVHGEKHIIFRIPILRDFRLVRQFFEYLY